MKTIGRIIQSLATAVVDGGHVGVRIQIAVLTDDPFPDRATWMADVPEFDATGDPRAPSRMPYGRCGPGA